MGKFLTCALALIAFSAANADEVLPQNCQKTVFSEEDSSYMDGYNCFYADRTILETYQIVKQDLRKRYPDDDDYKKLRDKLEVGKNHLDEFGEFLLIEYTWVPLAQQKELGYLKVTISYEAGDTTLLFVPQKTGVLADISFYIQ
ncbi:MAG: hypothetical protein LBE89_02920 [Helicobacteraceae bacterium]|jgi:hypothetical protein|nr:hypothetical protein [Helicobacteraceae bacterium]